MIHSQFEAKFYEQLDVFFQSQGFGFLPDQKQFRKSTKNGFQNIIFSISEAENVFWIEVNFGVRFEFVEQIAQQFLNNSFGYRPAANTLVISTGKFLDVKYFRYKVSNEADFEKVTQEIRSFFEEKGFDFLNTVDSISFIEETLNDSPTMPCRYLYNQVHRCFKGIIAAKLSDNRNFATITNIYRHFLLKNGTDQDLMNYERLVGFLHHYNAN
ncbi:MAG: hypothetical protein U5M51_08090 [Emticicia sp.]|nr:hypothetical protein [Emticicia sp.]